MTDVTVHDRIPDVVPEAPASRPRLLLIGTALASVAVAMGMAGLLGIYVRTRAIDIAQGNTWLPSGVVIPLTQPNMMMLTLVFSIVIMVMAVSSLSRNDRPMTYVSLGLVLVMGFAYISQTAYLLSLMELGAADSVKAPLFYAIIGTHVVVMVVAMVYVALMTLRALGGEYSAKDREGVYSAAMFWYVTVALYLVVWYAIYITK